MRLPGAHSVPKNNSKLHLCLATGVCTFAAACSTVQSDVVETATASTTVGLVYYLPIRTLAVDAKFQILDCGLNTTTDKAELLYDLVPTVTSSIAADRRRAFTIAKGLDGKLLKAMNFEVAQYENGTLKSFNMVADDRTGETATNILSGALKFGLALTGGTLFSAAPESQPEIIWLRRLESKDDPSVASIRAVCGDATDPLLKVHALTRQLSGAREATEAKTKAAAKVTEAEKAVTEARASLKAANEAAGAEDIAQSKEVLAAAVKELGEARIAAKKAPQSVAASAITQDIAGVIQKSLTYNATATFVPLEQAQLQAWPLTYPTERLRKVGIDTNTELKAIVQLKPMYALQTDVEGAPTFPVILTIDDRVEGIWIRSPAQAQLDIYVDTVGETTSRLSQAVSVPQWGQLTRLPLRNMAFAKNTTKLAFAPDGALLTLSSDATAAAEGASAAFARSGEMALDYTTKRRALLKELAAEDSAAGKAAIQEQIDLLTLEQQLAVVQSNVGPEREGQLSTLNFQIQQTQKQIELLELQAKLQALQAAPQ